MYLVGKKDHFQGSIKVSAPLAPEFPNNGLIFLSIEPKPFPSFGALPPPPLPKWKP